MGPRRSHVLARLGGTGAPALETRKLCDVCAEVTGMSGAGIMLMSGDVHRGSVCTTNEVSDLIERLQYALGEGPCVDAYQLDRPVLEADLGDPETPRWLGFAEPAIRAGVAAVFGFPLHVGAVRLGALNLYRDRPGPLTGDQHADALVLAEIAAEAIVALQSLARPGELAAALEDRANFEYVVHQAAGMVAAQLETSIGRALIRLRGYAFGNDRPLATVAADVVARRLRFEHGDGEKDGPS